MAYEKTEFHDNELPAINASFLNKSEQGIYDAHAEIAEMPHEAPDDDKKYSRYGKEWVPDVIQDLPPDDDKKYGMKGDGTWSEILEGDSTGFDYDEAVNKPRLNGHDIEGNKTSADYGIPVKLAGSFELHDTDFELDGAKDPFKYKALIEIEGCTENHFPLVGVSFVSLKPKTLCPDIEAVDGGIYVWAKSPSIVLGNYCLML